MWLGYLILGSEARDTALVNLTLLLPFIAADNRAEPIPAGAYPAELRAAIEAKGIVLREEPAARVAAIRGTAAVGMIGPDGRLRTVEVPQTVVFGDAR